MGHPAIPAWVEEYKERDDFLLVRACQQFQGQSFPRDRYLYYTVYLILQFSVTTISISSTLPLRIEYARTEFGKSNRGETMKYAWSG